MNKHSSIKYLRHLKRFVLFSILCFGLFSEVFGNDELIEGKLEQTDYELGIDELPKDMDNWLLVDARSSKAFALGSIPNSINLNQDAFDAQIVRFLERWSPGCFVLVYCDNAQCSSSKKLAQRLREDFQIKNVYTLKGGWQSWQSAANQLRSNEAEDYE